MRRREFLIGMPAALFAAAEMHPMNSFAQRRDVLSANSFAHYVEAFNAGDHETVVNAIDNASAWSWLKENIPFFECPDADIERTYYFRWWTYRKHIKRTPEGYVITEFLPEVPWAGRYNTISCAAGHHFYEGRWLRNRQYLDDYAYFWFHGGGEPHRYSFWAADAIYARYLALPDPGLLVTLLPDLVRNFQEWEHGWQPQKDGGVEGEGRLDPNGLFWQMDNRDGMEVSIGGSGYRATINSYMYGDAMAIASIAALAGRADIAREYRERAARIKKLVQEKLWDRQARFFKVLPRGENTQLADVRELHGYTPWYFNLPDHGYEDAWAQIKDPQGFAAPFGPTTAERRHPRFMFAHPHDCLWNGPSWPYATAVTLTALANLLNNYRQEVIGKADYLDLLGGYARSHQLKRSDGKMTPWIDEDLHPDTGEWLARSILQERNDPRRERGKDYNHSTFCDLVITGLVGLRPRSDNRVVVNPLVPEGKWAYFCLDRVPYHGRNLTVLYDRDGVRYERGKGLRVLADGVEIASAKTLRQVAGRL